MDELRQHPIDQLAEAFLERYRRGERPSLEAFIAEHPAHAAEIRELFPALLAIERLAPSGSESVRHFVQPQPERLGDYQIIRELGRGGMGIVYEAEHQPLGRQVALKVLPTFAAEKPTVLQRFTREAKAAGHLHHTNIVPVFDVGQCDGLHYYSMQFIKGQSLAEVIGQLRLLKANDSRNIPTSLASHAPSHAPAAEVAVTLVHDEIRRTEASGAEPPPPSDEATRTSVGESTVTSHVNLSGSRHGEVRYWRNVARIGVQLADALQFAHTQGVVHRDVKPSNILLDLTGTAWVTDFGLAHTGDHDLTGSGAVLGTLRYMAPEQLRGWADPRTDVYGLGLTIYELITLRPALDAEDKAELVKQIGDREPAKPRQIDRSIPQDLETIVLKAIEKEPGRRYQSAAELSEDLSRFLDLKPILARPTSTIGHLSRWCHRNPQTAALAMSVGVLLVVMTIGASTAAVWLARQAHVLREQTHELAAEKQDALVQLFHATRNEARAARNNPGSGRRLMTLDAVQRAAKLLPEVPHAAADVLELRQLAVAALTFADFKEESSIDTGRAIQVELNTDLTLIAHAVDTDSVTVRQVVGNVERARLEGPGKPPTIFFFSPDSKYLAVGYAHVEQGERESVVRVWDWKQAKVVIETTGYQYGIGFAPDSLSIAIPQLKHTVEVYDLDSGLQRYVLQTAGDPPYPQFRPTDTTLAVASQRANLVQCFDARSGEPKEHFRLPIAPEGIRWSPDGRYLAYGAADSSVGLWDVDSQQHAGNLVGHRSSAWPQEFAPDSRTLMTRSWDDRMILWDVASCRPLAAIPGNGVRWSSAGRHVAVHEKGKRTVIYRVFLPEEYHQTRCPSYVRSVAVASNGKLAAAAGERGVWLLDPQRNVILQHEPVGPSHVVAFHPAESRLVATSPQGILCWEIVPPDDGSRARLTEPRLLASIDVAAEFQRLAFDRQGEALAYVASDRRVDILSWRDATRRASLELASNLPGIENIAISPAGRWVAVVTAGRAHVSVWDTQTMEVVYEADLPAGYASLLFSPSGEQLVIRSWTEYIVLESETWRELHRTQREPGPCWAMDYSPDGRTLALAISNQLLRIHDAATLEPLFVLQSPVALDFTCCRFSPDGERLYAGSASGIVSCWDMGLIQQQLEELGVGWGE
jgi:serine/threonine protein kinase/WD40 repeat protein